MESFKKSTMIVFAILSVLIFCNSAFAGIPYFSSISPTEYEYNATSGISQFTYDIGQDDVGTTTATNTLYLNDSGTPVFIDSHEFTLLEGRDLVDDNFTFTYNGDHYVEIQLVYDVNTSENLTLNLPLSSFSNGIDYIIPAEEEESEFAGIGEVVNSMFAVVGVMITGIVVLMTGDLLVLAIVGAFATLLIGIIALLFAYVKGVFSHSAKKK